MPKQRKNKFKKKGNKWIAVPLIMIAGATAFVGVQHNKMYIQNDTHVEAEVIPPIVEVPGEDIPVVPEEKQQIALNYYDGTVLLSETSGTAEEGVSQYAPTVSKSVIGWSTSADGSNVITNLPSTSDGTLNLYAVHDANIKAMDELVLDFIKNNAEVWWAEYIDDDTVSIQMYYVQDYHIDGDGSRSTTGTSFEFYIYGETMINDGYDSPQWIELYFEELGQSDTTAAEFVGQYYNKVVKDSSIYNAATLTNHFNNAMNSEEYQGFYN